VRVVYDEPSTTERDRSGLLVYVTPPPLRVLRCSLCTPSQRLWV